MKDQDLEGILRNSPINKSMVKERVEYYTILELKDKRGFAKRYSDLPNSNPLPLLDLDYGESHNKKISAAEGYRKYVEIAKIFKKLATEGFYHPKTQFIVCEGEDGKPTIMAISPEVKPLGIDDYLRANKIKSNPKHKEVIKRKKEELKAKLKLKRLAGDSECEFNYGISLEGKIFYFDLHLFDKKRMIPERIK